LQYPNQAQEKHLFLFQGSGASAFEDSFGNSANAGSEMNVNVF
jgi:hypothetical protein